MSLSWFGKSSLLEQSLSCCFFELFVGDILFAGSVGRTDFPGGSMSTLIRGIREQLMPLPPHTTVNSGHGPSTTIGEEQLNNPYIC